RHRLGRIDSKRRSDGVDRLAADRRRRPAARGGPRRARRASVMAHVTGGAGTLYLVPNLLGAVAPERVLPARTIDVARGLAHWVVETPKTARAFLGTLALPRPIAELDIRPLDDDALRATLATLRNGADVGLLSDAGCPGVADPGAPLVEAAHENAIRVVPLVGPSAILLALMASGLNGQHFCFRGYLPAKAEARASALRALD